LEQDQPFVQNSYTKEFIGAVNSMQDVEHKDIVDKLEWNKTAMSAVMNGKRNIPFDKWEKFKSVYKSDNSNYLEKRRHKKLTAEKEGIPIYEDTPYTLGNVESYRDTPTEKADFWVTIPGLRNCNYGVRATGDSMHPLIRNHALVVGEEITDFSFIPSGDIYIVRAKNGIETIKYIQPHETDPKKFVLVPYNEKAKPTDILKKDILKIWKAKAVFNVL
jgi:phage repressor protein C with HTH and peptisase S24 domain